MNRWVLKSACGYYVGLCGNSCVWSLRQYWAWRWDDSMKARTFVKERLERFGSLDSFQVVRIVNRKRLKKV